MTIHRKLKENKIALVHDWFIHLSGSEKVFEQLYQLFPGNVFTLFNKNGMFLPSLNQACIRQSFLGYLPFVERYYRNLFPLFPLAVESFDLSNYDYIISSSHCMAKNIVKLPHQYHICYCHTPLRYIWDLHDQYLNQIPFYKRIIFKAIRNKVKRFDQKKAEQIDLFIANSHFVKKRIKEFYGKEAKVVYPPVRTDFFHPAGKKRGDFFITCSRLVPYKKIDLIIEAFNKMPDKKLMIVGDGPEEKKLKKMSCKNIVFLHDITDYALRELLQTAMAFVYAAVEDFGIILAEAISCGCPVIAFQEGGAKEIVNEICGILYPRQSTNSLIHAMQLFEKKKHTFQETSMHQYAKKFDTRCFHKEIKEIVDTYIRNGRGERDPALASFK